MSKRLENSTSFISYKPVLNKPKILADSNFLFGEDFRKKMEKLFRINPMDMNADYLGLDKKLKD